MIKNMLKAVARTVFGEYSVYHILQRSRDAVIAPRNRQSAGYRVELVDGTTIATSADSLMREQSFYAGDEAFAFACIYENRIVGLYFYWYGARYLTRNFWPLQRGEAKLVQIITSADMRGKGVANAMIMTSSDAMMKSGFDRMFARVWHSNGPSLRAFAGAGWVRCASVVEVNPFRRLQPIRLTLKR